MNILPQVTTVEELDALPVGVIAVDAEGCAWERKANRTWAVPGVRAQFLNQDAMECPPLTIVWQP